jgi:hypothetical protein
MINLPLKQVGKKEILAENFDKNFVGCSMQMNLRRIRWAHNYANVREVLELKKIIQHITVIW